MWIKKAAAFFNDVKKERLRLWCFELLGSSISLSISEVNCPEPDCPPVKTVILVMGNGRPMRSYIIHKTINEIGHEDIVHVFSKPPGSGEPEDLTADRR
jgi:hypothetical protein